MLKKLISYYFLNVSNLFYVLILWLLFSKYVKLFYILYISQTIYLLYLPNPSARAGYDTKSIFKRSLTGLNSEFSFS